MDIEIDTDSLIPVYEQIVQQVTQGILLGTLSDGDSLPSIRQLAGDLMINHNTVAKAYRQLENQRAVLTAGRRGTRVREKANMYIKQYNGQDAQCQLDDLMTSFKARGIAPSYILELLTQQMRQLKE